MTTSHPVPRQPLLHDLVVTVAAPSSALSGPGGQIRPTGVQGVFHADRRVLHTAVLTVDGREPDPVAELSEGTGATRFVLLARQLGDPGPDPTVRLDRVRRMHPDGMAEDIEITSTARLPVRALIAVALAGDLAPMETIKYGGTAAGVLACRRDGGTLTWSAPDIEITAMATATATATVGAVGGVDGGTNGSGSVSSGVSDGGVSDGGVSDGGVSDGGDAALRWTVEVPPGGRVTLSWRLAVRTAATAVIAPSGPVEWSRPEVSADDRRLPRLLHRSLDDLAALRLAQPQAPGDTFLGAGVPWYLTLFGRDSLWAARMLLPLGTGLAAGTLRALARRQGTRFDDRSGEAPGKIMHELRYGSLFAVSAEAAPVAYYGTVDATPLWISLLHDAWRWGLPAVQIEPLLPALRAAADWLTRYADTDGDGLIEYLDRAGVGLANQGWKDSTDAMRRRDGGIAAPPIALCEVQGYAYAAAVHAAALLDAFDEPGGQRLREYASEVSVRFRARYWVDSPAGPYPALALDGDKRPVDALTSNIGHLLGTGLLDEREEALVAARLAGPELSGGYGLRTMSSADAGYRPMSYHCGSIWPHDTAIVLAGLARAGFDAPARVLLDGLLAAAEAFDYRLPEVYGGDQRTRYGGPVPYPAACRPQAWSAAAAVAVLRAVLGLEADVPAGQLTVRPLSGAPLGAIEARGFRLADVPVDVSAARDGTVTAAGLPAGVVLRTGTAPVIPAQPRGDDAPATRP